MKRLIIFEDKATRDNLKEVLKKTHKIKACDMIMSYALNFKRNSERDVRIRIAAMKNGGKLMCEVQNWNYEYLK